MFIQIHERSNFDLISAIFIEPHVLFVFTSTPFPSRHKKKTATATMKLRMGVFVIENAMAEENAIGCFASLRLHRLTWCVKNLMRFFILAGI
jgi:hypothetical protein